MGLVMSASTAANFAQNWFFFTFLNFWLKTGFLVIKINKKGTGMKISWCQDETAPSRMNAAAEEVFPRLLPRSFKKIREELLGTSWKFSKPFQKGFRRFREVPEGSDKFQKGPCVSNWFYVLVSLIYVFEYLSNRYI